MKRKGGARKYLQQNFDLYLLLLPALIYVFIFHLLPMVGILIAFKDYNMFQVPGDPFRSILESPWAGFKYFEQVFKKSEFQQAFANTLIISLYKIIFTFPLPIIFAVFLNEVRSTKFQKGLQLIVYLPHFLSWAIIGSVAMTMFRPNSGLVNILLTNLGVISEGIPFLNEKWHWAITYLLIGVWQTMGWGTILYLAAITGINGELYEAAMIDGANRWKRMWHITLPGIKSTVVTLLILNLGRVMGSNLERLTALENSQVKDFQYQLAVYIYNKGIGAGKFSAATAVGLFQSLIGLILVLLSDKFAKKLGEDGLL